jgi:hypothetical protein
MPTKRPDLPSPDPRPAATPETLSDMAAHADLGPLDDRTALIVKYCEATIEKTIVTDLKTRFSALQEKYKALLRELRDKLQSIKFDDFLKIVIGLLGGFLIRAFSQQGTDALKDYWVDTAIFFFIVSLIFLVVSYLSPSARKKELDKELKNLNSESKT